jgi:Tfp pilus assembly protein PilN
MTTTMAPVPAASALRILPITANLMPREIVESRQGRRLRRAVIAGLAGVVVMLAAWYGLAVFQTSGARSDLATAQDTVQDLTRQQKTYDKLVETQAKSQAISTELASLMATDLRWSRLLASLRTAAPTGVSVTGVTGTLNNNATTNAKATANTTVPGQATTGAVGTLTVTGTAPSRAAVAAYVDALAKVRGLANPLVGSATMENTVVQFSVRLDITAPSLGGRFTSPSPSPSAAK